MCLADGGGGEEGQGALCWTVCLFILFFSFFFIYLFVYFFCVLGFNLAWGSGRIKEKARKPESRRWLGRSKRGTDGIRKIIP